MKNRIETLPLVFSLTLVILSLAVLFSFRFAEAYSAGCSFAQEYGTQQQILSLAQQNTLSGGQFVARIISFPPSGCTAGDVQSLVTALQGANQSIQDAKDVINNPNTSYEQKVQAAKSVASNPTTTSCASVLAYMTSPFTCMFRTFVTYTAASLIYIASWLLTAAGVLFNWLILNTVVQFGSVYTEGVKTAVETGWTAFRDIANILIIGMFTFVAISMILGVKQFGEKKLIANVLLVAVFINFSLLGTKMVIDASNFVAGQIYTAAALGTNVAQKNTTTLAAVSDAAGESNSITGAGIAGSFIHLLGVESFGQTQKALDNTAEARDSGWIALFHGIFVFIILVGAALVLFYGSFLLISRVILLIVLMLTAAVAAASFVVPKWSASQYGWDTWKSSLIKSAVLAPVLMLFLWITLNVSTAVYATGSGGSFGRMSADPTWGPDIKMLVNYCIILGLLFISFKLSNSLAGKIAGFDFASIATALPLTMASRFGAGLAGRLTLGAGAYFAGKSIIGSAKGDRDRAAQFRRREEAARLAGNTGLANMAEKYATTLEARAARKASWTTWTDKLAGSRYNLMDTGLAKATAKQLGVTGFAAGASGKKFLEKSYADQVKARVEAGEKIAAKLAPSGEQNEKARLEAKDQIKQQRELGLRQLEAARDAERANAEAVKAFQQLPQKLAEAQQKQQQIEGDVRDEKTKVAADRGLTQAQRKSLMDAQDARIAHAQENVQTIQRGISAIDKPFEDAKKRVEDYNKETERLGEETGKAIVAGMGKAAEKIAEQVGAKQGSVLTRIYGAPSFQNKAVKDAVLDKYKGNRATARWRKVFESMKDEATPPAPPPPPAGGGTP